MPRPARGAIHTHRRADGLTTYLLRIMVDGQRHLIRLGHEEEGWTAARAERERQRISEAIRVGAWTPPATQPAPEPPVVTDAPSLHDVATRFLRRKTLVVDENTASDLRWRITHHLLPFFAALPVSAVTNDTIYAYIEHKLAQRRHVIEARAAGRPLCDDRGIALRPLSNTSINMALATLAAILDEPECEPWVTKNPARGKGKRLKTHRDKGNFLETDELKDLLAAAERLDRRVGPAEARADEAHCLRAQGATLAQIATRLGVSVSTAHYYVARRARPACDPPLRRLGIVALLGLAGPRVSEAARLARRDIDLRRGRLTIADAKTDTGIRIVNLSPRLVEILQRVFASDPRPPDAPALASRAATSRDKDNIARLLSGVVTEANRMRALAGTPALPANVTPHTLRRTYITLLLEANAPLPYVMAQVGHKDESTVLSIYARVLQRKSRDTVGQAFDELLQ